MTTNNKWPIYFKDRLTLGDSKSDTVIVTLWTPKEVITGALLAKNYAACGQLYTRRGINFLLRNLLANPGIKRLLVCGADHSGSGKLLIELWEKEKPEDLNLDKEIPADAVKALIKTIDILDLCGITDPDKIKNALSQKTKKLPLREVKIFPEPVAKENGQLPAEIDLVKIRRKTIGTCWLAALKHLLNFGLESEAIYHYFTQGENQLYEVLNLALVVEDEDPKDFQMYDFFPFKKAEVEKYIKEVFQKDRGDEPYTYGERLFDYDGVNQIAEMAKKLTRFQKDHGALAVLWNPKIDNFPIRKPWRTPCLTLIQGQIYQNKLFLTAYFRSNDMFGAWPLNAFALRYLQGKLAEKVGVSLGSLITISNMASLYDHDFTQAAEAVKNNREDIFEWDPRGNLVIKTEGKKIVIDQISPEGILLRTFRFDGAKPQSAKSIGYELQLAGCFSTLSHARYIGDQLAKAEMAVKKGLKFEQDKELV